jgi:hypothetical protein
VTHSGMVLVVRVFGEDTLRMNSAPNTDMIDRIRYQWLTLDLGPTARSSSLPQCLPHGWMTNIRKFHTWHIPELADKQGIRQSYERNGYHPFNRERPYSPQNRPAI